jgi:hypothetical protein
MIYFKKNNVASTTGCVYEEVKVFSINRKVRQDSAACLLIQHIFASRICNMVKVWLDFPSFDPMDWSSFHDVESWWLHIVYSHPGRRKQMATLVMIVS